MLEQGWVIHHCKGNFLFFQRRPLPRARLLAITTECTQRDPKGDEQVDEYIQIALGKKWQLLCIGDLESVLPARRRLYFYTQDPDAVAWSRIRSSISNTPTEPIIPPCAGGSSGLSCCWPPS